MAFVKLDCGMLDSTIWFDRDARELFITALLMATPFELTAPARQLEVDSLTETGFTVPAGWYGKVEAAGLGIIKRAGMSVEVGLPALKRLGQPEIDSRTPDFEGRRLVRIDGGYLALNFAKYREKDHTAAERSKRYRERLSKSKTRKKSTPSPGESIAVRMAEQGDQAGHDQIASAPADTIEQERIDALPPGLR